MACLAEKGHKQQKHEIIFFLQKLCIDVNCTAYAAVQCSGVTFKRNLVLQ